ncbi:MAG: hypothetical protein IJI41_11910 [Anaerolineaceae bacterium]|nr:hypothetical protein [Anaerolineaceae bacterium]
MTRNNKIKINKLILFLWVALLIFVCTKAMELSPIWNGQIPQHRNQYEIMAQSLLNGHLHLDIDVSPELLELDNPYDPMLRAEKEVDYKFDHAFYNGRYYMYFGVVPAILIFAPFRLIFGKSLATYHATQLFSALIIIGLFNIFGFLRKRFFPKISSFTTAALSTAFSLTSVWYFSDAPALYCTAISSAVCMMVWCFYFYFRAVFDAIRFNKRILFAIIGAAFGALAFGCRPPVAIANITALPLFAVFLKTNKMGPKEWRKIFLIALPYIIIGALLMMYNYARFEDPFEFGQKYQLSNWNQREFSLLNGLGLIKQGNGFIKMFIQAKELSGIFPYVQHSGIFFEFPVFLISIGTLLFSNTVRTKLKHKNCLYVILTAGIAIILITIIEIAMSPLIEERYHFDLNYLIAISTFLVIGFFYIEADSSSIRKYNIIFTIISLFTILTAVLLFFVPYDFNFSAYYPETLEHIREIMWQFK